jgi:DeoR family transcriptional regulator, ulaG and ulaABCDEF operon transcriptional repressor
MHASQREKHILELLERRGFLSFRDLDASLPESPATLRRDLERLAATGRLRRVRGGAEPISADGAPPPLTLAGAPFHENASLHQREKAAIGRAAAALCQPGEAIMIDGGSTTLQMCPHLAGLNLQVLTNSLHIVGALLPQAGTRVLVPAGSVFREQNIILSASGEESMPRFHAPKLFMGAAALGPQGPMQADVILTAAERRLIDRADEVVVLVDSSKFNGPSGHVVCELSEIDVVVTDEGVTDAQAALIEGAGVRLVRAGAA